MERRFMSASVGRPCRRPDPRLRRDRRHVDSARDRARAEPHGRRSRSARHGTLGNRDGGLHKKNQAEDIAGVMNALKIQRADIVGHDIGNMVAFAFARLTRIERRGSSSWTRPFPASGPGKRFSRTRCCGISASAAPIWNGWSRAASASISIASGTNSRPTRKRFSEDARRHYATLYSLPGAMHAGFLQFAAFDQDAIDNRAAAPKGRLVMPVLAIGGENSFGHDGFRHARRRDDVTKAIIPTPATGSWRKIPTRLSR